VARPLSEQTILVTGGSDGHGRALAAELATAGATVLIHGRDETRGRQTLDDLRTRAGHDRVHWYRADLASLAEVRGLADRIATEQERLDVLVNNAGIGATTDGAQQRELSRDGIELRFAVNYLAGYLLARSLLPLLERSTPARIVNVASAGQAPIDFSDPMLEHGYDGWRAYAQSKLAQIMFTFDLAEELEDRGVTANCLHPATFMGTRMVLDAGITPASSVEEGVAATLRLVTQPELATVTGRYYSGTHETAPNGQALDAAARRRLHGLSEELIAAATATTPA
jgi:NAD(P)-dependent dehydrogenase (short-subunit alcohol dehydrogenase family)